MTCHQNWNGFKAEPASHSAYTAATNCAGCHAGNTVVSRHNGANIVTERAGMIYDGADVSVTEGAKISQQITGVTRTGSNLAITWTANYAGTAVDPCNTTPTATAPAFNYTGQNFSILKAFFQGDDIGNANNGNASPGQPNSTNLSFTALIGNTSCTGNVATSTIALTAKEAAITGNGRVALQGKPQILFTPTATAIQVRAKSPIYDFALATGAAIPARRAITDTSLCLKCHVGSLYQHGGNRVDNVELCVMCHNEASSEQNVRVGMGVDASKAYDGKGGQTYGFKTMLHAVHSSGDPTHKPLVIYRTRGIYAFGPDVTKIPNWPGSSVLETDLFTVYGATAGAAQLPHFFATAHYPRNMNDCSACHVSTFDMIPNQGKVIATTIYTGLAPYDNQLDDTLQGAASAACTSCHQSITVKAHAEQTGWFPSIFEAGRQTIINVFK
jgi:OmcA/MtrC family decaheme c-type cytochrome